MTKNVNILKTLLRASVLGLLLTNLVACTGGEEKAKPAPPRDGKEQEKAEEDKQKQYARYRKMFIENKTIEIAHFDENSLALRLGLNINNKIIPVVYVMQLKKDQVEQFDLQQKSSEIRHLFPNHDLEVSVYKFKFDKTIDVLGLEYRLLRETESRSDRSSQFVLMVLDKSIDTNLVLKTKFQFPSQSDLKTWSLESAEETLEKP